MTLTRTEAYLSTFHDANPGVTSRAFEALPVTCGERAFSSTYASLISMLPDADADATADAQPLTVLDLACGDGHLLALLHASHPDGHLALIGVDLSAGELAAARARLGEGAALYRCKAQQLPLASGSVDGVFSHLALMLMDDADGVMRELRRVLKPGGLFLLTPDGREHLRQRYRLALRPLCSTPGPDGDLQFEERYRQFSARVAR